MFPWFWLWSPHYHLFNQNVQPQTDWIFGNIAPRAGNAATEQRIHESVASYGRQLGLITEVLLGIADPESIGPEQASQSLERLKTIRAEIEQVKAGAPSLPEAAALLLRQLAEQDPAAYAELIRRCADARPRLPPAGHRKG
ncbi:hypothetical protein GCM10028796_07600 [Ramlibacter monticola]|uniref:hypothetical protein n=1 Tax=Ramlibacter monticola TaxID=1926872 RepID=UPI001F20F576|nr:hypothetical protein [Ramlibacter monticola]